MPTVSFAELAAPVLGNELVVEGSLLFATAHQLAIGVIDIGIVEGCLLIRSQFGFALSHGSSQRVDAPVVVGILQRARHILPDAHVARHIAQTVIVVVTHTTRCAAVQMVVCTVGDSIPKFLLTLHADTLDIGIDHHRCRVLTYHTIAMTRAAPLGQIAALEVCIDESSLHLLVHRGINEVEEGEEAAEGIPHASVGKEIAGKYLAVVGAVVNRLALCVKFVEAAGEVERAPQTGVEGAHLLLASALHLDASQHIVPGLAAGLCHFVKGLCSQFAQVAFCLLQTDER